MTWLIVVLGGHFANALAFVIDKILLAGKMKHPAVYVFYIGSLGMLSFILWPFGTFSLMSANLMIQGFISGASFMLALLCFFHALKKGETTRVVPFVGGLVPVWTIIFASILLHEFLNRGEWMGVALLVIGAIIISYEPVQTKNSITISEAVYIVSAAGFFALSYTLAKVVFNGTEFINGFLWMRLFAFLSVVPLLLSSATRRAIFSGGDDGGEKPTPLFFIGQALGAIGFVLLNWGIQLAPSVSIVNALQGVQYAFLFVLVVVLTLFAPGLIREKLTKQIVIQKVLALIVLAFGLVFVA